MSRQSQTTITTTSSSKGNGNGQACAACKYQRRKCAPDCILAPYFPHDSQRQFLNAHKLFGVSNITKIIKQLDTPAAKDHAMKTIIFQSDARAADPVGGCYRIIQDLQRQIDFAKAELDLVLQHLALCRAAALQTTTSHDHDDHLTLYNSNDHDHHHDFLNPQVIHGDFQEDDVSSWVVQDSLMDVKPSPIGVDQHLHVVDKSINDFEAHHQRLVFS